MNELAPLWRELHRHHREVADYPGLVDDLAASWASAGDRRSLGVGRSLLAAAEEMARARGFDTMKIAVMKGNSRAEDFYEASGYAVAEHVLYRRLERD